MTMVYKIAIKDKRFDIEIDEISNGTARVNVNGKTYDVTIENYEEIGADCAPPRQLMVQSIAQTPASAVKPKASILRSAPRAAADPQPVARMSQSPGTIMAPIPGRIISITVQAGDTVKAGQTLATMEAMKMENNIVSNMAGTVKEIHVQKGSEVATGDVIMVIE
jgi:biotin carboxyl carrier protein